jgi:putative membrane protein
MVMVQSHVENCYKAIDWHGPIQLVVVMNLPENTHNMAIGDNDPRIPLAQERTELASLRTLWAAERTLMAWMRTALAMVGFGFAMDRVLSYLDQQQRGSKMGVGYYWLGLAMVVTGIVLLVLAVWEHRRVIRFLEQDTRSTSRFSLPIFGASVLLAISAAALLLLLLRFPH